MEYNQMMKNIDLQIESLLLDIIENKVYKSPKAEERLTALCLGREYIIDKIKEENKKEFIRLYTNENKQEVNNEG